ncbi:hypothetical protein CAL7716_060160 [Calothrix sp. PCC 7716]|nr:hypothetical protein CAL7716_060160 [Calothrix sp. PCC 7716]
MLKRILLFSGWVLTAFFFLIGIVGFAINPVIAISMILWGLLFLPLLYKLTARYGLVGNIIGRIFVFLLSAIVIGILAPTQSTIQSNRQPSPATTVASVPTSSAKPKVEIVAPTPTTTPLILSQVDSETYYLDNNTVPEVLDYARYIAQKPNDTERYELVHKAVKCNLPIRSEEWYLKFITLMLTARFPEKFDGNQTYFLAKNIVRYQPETGSSLLTTYKTIMCSN